MGAIKLTTFNFRDCNFVRGLLVIAIGLNPNRWTGGLSNFLAIDLEKDGMGGYECGGHKMGILPGSF